MYVYINKYIDPLYPRQNFDPSHSRLFLTHATHTKISTHATHVTQGKILWTHAKI